MKKCNCGTDFDQSNFENIPYEDVKALIGYDECYNVICVDAPETITDEQKEKIDIIKNDGDGDKYLSDDGTYKEITSGSDGDYLPLTAGPDNALTGQLYIGGSANGILPTETNTNSYVGLTNNPINQCSINTARIGEITTLSSSEYNRLISSCHIIPRGDQNYNLGISEQPWYNVFARQHYVRCIIAFDPDNTGDTVVDLMSTIKLQQDAQIISTGDIPLIPAEGNVIKAEGNIELAEGIKIQVTETVEINGVETQVDYAIAQVGEYLNVINPRTGDTIARWLQTDFGNTHIPANFSTANNPITGKYIAYDVGSWVLDSENYPALQKQVLATFTEGVLQLPVNFFNPVNNVIEGITLEQLNVYAYMYSLGLYPVAKDPDVLTFRATRLVINDAVAYFDYNFTKITGNTVERYEISVTGTGAAVNTLKCGKIIYQIDALPIQFYLPYGNGTPITVPISDSGIQLNITYKDTGSCGATISATNDNVSILNAYRTSTYNGTSEGQVLPEQIITDTPVNVDDTIYTSFNDEVNLRIMKEGNYYEIKFIVGNGFAIGEYKKINS